MNAALPLGAYGRSQAAASAAASAFSGPTDFVHVGDTAAAFLQCADGGPAGAHVFNLHGDTVDVADVVLAIEEECPAARGTRT